MCVGGGGHCSNQLPRTDECGFVCHMSQNIHKHRNESSQETSVAFSQAQTERPAASQAVYLLSCVLKCVFLRQ